MHFLTLLLVSLVLANAQQSQPLNLLTVPGCSTAYTIVNSCAQKLHASATITSVAWSCVCYDNSGNYVPTSYDNAASSCSSFLTGVYHTTGNPFLQYLAGFCTDPSYAPATNTAVPTKGSSASASSTPVVTSQVRWLSLLFLCDVFADFGRRDRLLLLLLRILERRATLLRLDRHRSRPRLPMQQAREVVGASRCPAQVQRRKERRAGIWVSGNHFG